MSTQKTVLVILHEGFEEIEAICPIDLLSRGNIAVTIASRESGRLVRGRSNCVIEAQVMLDDVLQKPFDMIFLPGGPGSPRMVGDARIIDLVQRQVAADRWIAAICAAPSVLAKAGVLKPNDQYTAHPCTLDVLPHPQPNVPYVIERKIITSYGPGAAMEFGLAMLGILQGRPVADKVAADVGWRASLVQN